ncbi:hypothetical protein [Pseudactinotalea sp. HY158]|uniref:hypothetical protein n=1 Tax=Pseudactinotalea sp. HY158 TaxID=2654547 RepID=UPI00129C6B2B|nr:hypothetical protein [Pseudactinotalea sp. HY158]QGH69026.1 hypothetical protein GCE65_05560 [Pseudactinotalea sp. HY158]
MAAPYGEHLAEQVAALRALTFTQWFDGRSAAARRFRPTARDLGEQALRADYIADKARWLRTYEPGAHPTLAAATLAARGELPDPAPSSRRAPRAWADRLDAEIAAAAAALPARQWASTLVPVPDGP